MFPAFGGLGQELVVGPEDLVLEDLALLRRERPERGEDVGLLAESRAFSAVTPSFSRRPAKLNLPARTPMDPVSVCGWATILVAAMEIQ